MPTTKWNEHVQLHTPDDNLGKELMKFGIFLLVTLPVLIFEIITYKKMKT